MIPEPAHEKGECCESCEWDTAELTWYEFRTHADGGSWMCHVCAWTPAGSALQYPTQYPNGDVLRMVAWQTNYLADLIRKLVP